MKNTDIFIKTYKKDFCWVNYLLKSIKKYVTGYRKIVIVTDSGDELKLNIDLPIDIHYEDLPIENSLCPLGIGYIWGAHIFLNWNKYTDADTIYRLDSDMMFYDKFDLSFFKKNDKYKCFYRYWDDVGDHPHRNWEKGANHFIKCKSDYDFMSAPIYFASKLTTEKFLQWTTENWGGTWEYIINNYKILNDVMGSGPTEYHMYFNFVKHCFPDEYEFIHIYDETDGWNVYSKELNKLGNRALPLIQFWSWGGMDNDLINRMESYLND